MACDPVTPGADESAGLKRVLTLFGGIGAGAGAVLAYLEAAGLGASLGGAAVAILLGAAVGYALGVAIGFAVEWFTRLKAHTPDIITLHGEVQCAFKDSVCPPPFHDGDWNFNLGTGDDASPVLYPDGLTVGQVRTMPAPGE